MAPIRAKVFYFKRTYKNDPVYLPAYLVLRSAGGGFIPSIKRRHVLKFGLFEADVQAAAQTGWACDDAALGVS